MEEWEDDHEEDEEELGSHTAHAPPRGSPRLTLTAPTPPTVTQSRTDLEVAAISAGGGSMGWREGSAESDRLAKLLTLYRVTVVVVKKVLSNM